MDTVPLFAMASAGAVEGPGVVVDGRRVREEVATALVVLARNRAATEGLVVSGPAAGVARPSVVGPAAEAEPVVPTAGPACAVASELRLPAVQEAVALDVADTADTTTDGLEKPLRQVQPIPLGRPSRRRPGRPRNRRAVPVPAGRGPSPEAIDKVVTAYAAPNGLPVERAPVIGRVGTGLRERQVPTAVHY